MSIEDHSDEHKTKTETEKAIELVVVVLSDKDRETDTDTEYHDIELHSDSENECDSSDNESDVEESIYYDSYEEINRVISNRMILSQQGTLILALTNQICFTQIEMIITQLNQQSINTCLNLTI